MAIDFSTDYDLFDNTETVTLTAQPAGTTDSVPNSLKQSLQIRDQAGGWTLLTSEVNWFLPGDEITATPEIGDTITEAGGTVWSIVELGHDPQTNKYEARCVKER